MSEREYNEWTSGSLDIPKIISFQILLKRELGQLINQYACLFIFLSDFDSVANWKNWVTNAATHTSAINMDTLPLHGIELIKAIQQVDIWVKDVENLAQGWYDALNIETKVVEEKKFKSLRIQLIRHYDNLNRLKEQVAMYAPAEAPIHLQNQLDREDEIVAGIEKELREIDKN